MDETVYDAAWRAYKAAPRAVANGPSRSAVRAAVDAALAARQPVGPDEYVVGLEVEIRTLRQRAIRAHQICNLARVNYPEIGELADDGCLHEAIHDILRVDHAARQPVGSIPAGFALVPERFGIPADVWQAAALSFGGPGSGEDELYMDCTAWIGKVISDDGSNLYGLHLSCDECPEEGSVTLAKFAASPAQSWVVADGQGLRWRKWGDFGPEWTTDRDAALHFARRTDAEAFAKEDEDAWLIQPVGAPAQEVEVSDG